MDFSNAFLFSFKKLEFTFLLHENIYFYENCLEIKRINNVETKIFYVFLTYISECCLKCRYANEGCYDIIKWNFKRNCKIKITKVCSFNSLLLLNKQRFICKHCRKNFTTSTNVVDFHKQISNDTNLNIKLELMQKGSEKNIAERNNVSSNHINRILDKLVKNNGILPKKLGINEFKSTEDNISKMDFIIITKIIKIFLILIIVENLLI